MSTDWSQTPAELPPNVGEPPTSILRAAKLMYLGAVLAVLNVAITLSDRDAITEQVRRSLQEAGLDLTDEAIDSRIAVVMAGAAVVGLVIVGMWVLMAVSNKKGKSWARITATVLGVASILTGVRGLAAAGRTAEPVALIMTMVSVALSATILYLLWRSENGPYYAFNSQRRV